jgi:hypothetical protein
MFEKIKVELDFDIIADKSFPTKSVEGSGLLVNCLDSGLEKHAHFTHAQKGLVNIRTDWTGKYIYHGTRIE